MWKTLHWELWHWWKNLKKTQVNGKIFCAHGLEELILVICPYYSKEPINSVKSLSNSNGIFLVLQQIILEFVWNHKISQIDKAILRKNKAGGFTVSDFKHYCQTVVIKQYVVGIKTDTHIKGIE